ncbi:hypothetical protein MNBD_BACTEROID01-2853 [hydrothermal vent metagenome]|uniref:Anti-sigma factor n=1 Tax=hydrothermal vent metagenome TaxID=652676 RepID=A0A3B0THN7_9ZZZZ
MPLITVVWLRNRTICELFRLSIKDTWDASLQRNDTSGTELLNFYKNQASRNNSPLKNIRLWKRAAGIAAVLAIGLMFAVLSRQSFDTRSNLVTYTVPLGSRSQVVLADGTIVDLNSGSKLQYPSNFNSENREVSLSGEAFFNVTSDKSNPFIVKTSDFDITVTGTKFNVCTYDDNNFSSAALLEGKITLSAPNIKPLELKPGEKIELNRDKKKLSYTPVDEKAETAWKNGQFIFHKIAFPELIKRLERWYDVRLNYNSKEFKSMLYTGSFKNQETIWQVLDALRLTSPIEYSRKNSREFDLIYRPMQ